MPNDTILELISKLLAKIGPRDGTKAFWLLVFLIAFLSIAFAIVFVGALELEYVKRSLPQILLITLVIFLSILLVSTAVVVRTNHSIEKLTASGKIMENLFELAISANTLKILIPIVTAVIVFLGWDSWKNLKTDIIRQIDPTGQIDTMKVLINSSRALHGELRGYVRDLLPIGTIVAFDGKQKLPTGWAPCDGDTIHINKDSIFVTPNLINRFILGTTSSNSGTHLKKAIGDTGGTKIHSHPLQFSLDVVTLPNQQASSNAYIKTVVQDEQRLPASHTHRINVNLIKEAQQTENLPPYYALIFIIKYR